MTRVHAGLSREETAALVCSTLELHGIRVVLSGGAVVSIYSDEAYVSMDLDFVRTGLAKRVDAAMSELGFRRKGRHWQHADSPYAVDFPPGPVGVGDRIVTAFAERRTAVGVLRLLAPTECVMDRLAGWFHWNDEQCLEQALAVAERQAVDLAALASWAEEERSAEAFREFRARLARRGGAGSPR